MRIRDLIRPIGAGGPADPSSGQLHSGGMAPRTARTGDDLASAGAILTRRLDEARDVIRTVLTNPPFHDDHVDLARPAFPADAGSSPLEDARLLRGYLDRFKAIVFNGSDSIALAVSGNRLNKVSRRLCQAAERVVELARPVHALSCELALTFSGYPSSTYEQAALALLVISDWGSAWPLDWADQSLSREMARNILDSVARDGKVRLAFFVCPPVEFAYFSSAKPELYLRNNMHGSVLSRQANRLRDLFRGLERAQLHVDVLALIGDTDEEDYLWQGIPVPENLNQAVLDAAREQLVRSVTTYLTERVGATDHPRVLPRHAVHVSRLSSMAHSQQARDVYTAVAAAPLEYFDQGDFDAEMAIMKDLWAPGSYYSGLNCPDDATLTKIVKYKCATYAMQGVIIWELERDLVLIQTERPTLLRSKMLNAGRRYLGLPLLPATHFFRP